MSFSGENVVSEHLGHLGLVAGVINDLGIIDKIDSRLELQEHKGGIVSYGRRVAAMVINGLGFMNSRLSMTSHYFKDKPVAQLLGDEITAEHLNDDCLGRALDKIAEYGVTKLYSEISFEIAKEKNLLSQRMHMDTTSFSLTGRYDVEIEDSSPVPTYGYSKDHRPDLKQVMMSLIQNGEANIPLWMEPLDGNTSDTTSFHKTVHRVKGFIDKLKDAPDGLCFVVDAAFYAPEKLAELDSVYWITRVPAKLKEAKQLLSIPKDSLEWQPFDENYRASEHEITLHGIKQRWLVVESRHAMKREKKTFHRRLEKQTTELTKKLWHLGNQVFQCANDAEKAVKQVVKTSKFHDINYEIVGVERHVGRGRPKPGAVKSIVGYQVISSLSTNIGKVRLKHETLGRFILATNQLDIDILCNHAVLIQYKEQSTVESGFKFIKDNAFELDSFYLKTPSRIGALMMVMTLCLMVYNFAQYKMRKCIKENGDVVPNQVGKPIENPTMKWIAELMQMIAVVTITTEVGKHRIIANLKKIHQRIIAYFGESALVIYGLPPDLKRVDIDHSNYKNIVQWCET